MLRSSFFYQSLTRAFVGIRHISSAPPPRRTRNLDHLAQFRRPDRPSTQLSEVLGSTPSTPERGKGLADDKFETSANVPVGTSFQEVPSPSSPEAEDAGTKIVEPVPAMKDVPPSPTADQAVDDRSKGLGRTKEMTVQGVVLPPKPRPPGEEECCMSGCVHCVYTIYAEDLEQYTEALDKARKALIKANTDESTWPEELRTSGTAEEIKIEEKEKIETGMDPSMAAFLALENKLKKR